MRADRRDVEPSKKFASLILCGVKARGNKKTHSVDVLYHTLSIKETKGSPAFTKNEHQEQ
jgi:hypothetical protein